MTPPDLERELQSHGASLQALAAALLCDGPDADDAVQETWLLALTRPPCRPGTLGGWLHAVLRSVAGKVRRTGARRERRERAAARAEATPGADARMMQQETLRAVVGAVLELDEAHRTVVWQRFFEGRRPAAIAARTGAPLATIKSRLQRGLALLRERLDRGAPGRGERRGDWRRGLALAFGLEPARALGIGAGAAAAGGTIMGTGAKVLFGGAAALVAVVAAILLTAGAPPRMETLATANGGATIVPAASDARAASAVADAPAATNAQREAVPVAKPTAAATLATVRGRCVDAHGAPLAGVKVECEDRGNGKGGPVAEPMKLQQTTGDDGRFEFTFPPPPTIDLFLQAKDAVPIARTGVALAAGSTTELGDVVLWHGTLLGGRVVDTDGTPVAGAEVRFDLAESGRVSGSFEQLRSRDPRTDAAGRFAVKLPFLPGEYVALIVSEVIERGNRVTLRDGTDVVDHEIVVRKRAVVETIAGVVVDENDRPVSGVDVSGHVDGSSRTVYTDADGRFELVRQPGRSPDRFPLSLTKQGYERSVPEKIGWGRRDLRFVLRTGLALDLHVTDPEGRPVEVFAVRAFPQDGSRQDNDSRDYKVRSEGRHADGDARITGLLRGPCSVFVEPGDAALAASGLVPIVIAEPGPLRLDLRLSRFAERTLRLRRGDGSPVTGAKLQFVDLLGHSIDARTLALSIDEWWRGSGPGKVLLLQTVTTDEHGEATLRARSSDGLALIAPGPGYCPEVIRDVALSEPDALVVTVRDGARLRGIAHPLSVVREIRRAAGLGDDGPPPAPMLQEGAGFLLPGFRLRRSDANSFVVVPADKLAPAIPGADGAFAIDGIDAGMWQLWLHAPMRDGNGDAAPVASVTLRDGETTNVDIDLTAWTPGEVVGQALWNGKPLASESIRVMVDSGVDILGNQRAREHMVSTDPEGRFHLRAHQGRWSIAWARRDDKARWTRLRALEVVAVAAGTTATAIFHLETGTLRVRVLDRDGKPVAGVPVQVLDASGTLWREMSATDANGVAVDELEAERFTLAVLPRRLLDPKAQQEIWRANPGNRDPFATLRLRLADAQIEQARTREIELRLPAAWNN